FLRGGGAVDLVTLDAVEWTGLPDRQEAGSPNVIGAAAMGVACDALTAAGMDRLAAEEHALAEYARARLTSIRGVELYGVWSTDAPRVGILPFNLHPYPHHLLAEILSAEYGVGVRSGCFCAHPLVMKLLCVGDWRAAELRE